LVQENYQREKACDKRQQQQQQHNNNNNNNIINKGHPITGQEDPEGEQMYSSTLPLTSALDVGGWSATRLGRFTPGKESVPIV
jgi:hypothetical protein